MQRFNFFTWSECPGRGKIVPGKEEIDGLGYWGNEVMGWCPSWTRRVAWKVFSAFVAKI
jgi:hypothetical protein